MTQTGYNYFRVRRDEIRCACDPPYFVLALHEIAQRLFVSHFFPKKKIAVKVK